VKSLLLCQNITFHNDADVKSSCRKLFTLSNTFTNEQRPSIRQRSKRLISILLTFMREILQHQILITLRVSCRRCKMYMWWWASVCVSVWLSVAICTHYCTDPDVTQGMVGVPPSPSCALLGRFAIGAWDALLWQHSTNIKCQRVLVLALSMPG